jgi:hypothetical protein
MMQWFGPPPSAAFLTWKWRGSIYHLLYHRKCLPFFWPFTIIYEVTPEESLRQAQPEIERLMMEKRKRATRYLRALHGIPKRHP